jgi:hypothetical protein
MAIQFLCSACGQPVEVDDDMANLTVTCPYCRKVVTTPTQSTLTARPDATAVGPLPPGIGPVPQPFAPVLTPPPRRSVLGWVALACSAGCILASMYAAVTAYSLVKDLDPKTLQTPDGQKIIQERLQGRRDVQIAGTLGPCVFPLAGMVCAIIALAIGARPRWPAITALCLLGAMILVSCAGIMIQAAAARSAAG